MSKPDPRNKRHTQAHSESDLDIDEGADVLETREDAIEAQRNDAPERRDDIISLDPPD